MKALVPPDEFDTSDQYTTLAWRFTEHRDGESAKFSVGGINVSVNDYDGDCSEWYIWRGSRSNLLASGGRYDGTHFFECLRDAEAALRRIITEQAAALRLARAS